MEKTIVDLRDIKHDAMDLSKVLLIHDVVASNNSLCIRPDPDVTKMEHNEITPRDLKQNQTDLKQEIQPQSESISEVKEEIKYCLSCSYNDTDFKRLKFHIFRKHSTGAAVIANSFDDGNYNMYDFQLFCVKETCTFSTTLCKVYEEHLMNCCLLFENLSVVEKQRLNSTFKFILDFHNKHSLSAVPGFLDYVSTFNKTLMCKDDEDQLSKNLDNNNVSPISADSVSMLDISLSSGNPGMNIETSLSSIPTPVLLFTTLNTNCNSLVDKLSIREKTKLSLGDSRSLTLSVSEQEGITHDHQLTKSDPSTTCISTRTEKSDVIQSDEEEIISENLDVEIDVAGSPIDVSSFKEETTGDGIKEEVKMIDGDCCTKDLDASNQQPGKITTLTKDDQSASHTPYNHEKVRMDTDMRPFLSDHCYEMNADFSEKSFKIQKNSERVSENNKVIHVMKTIQSKNLRKPVINHGDKSLTDNQSVITLKKTLHTSEKSVQCDKYDVETLPLNSSLIHRNRSHSHREGRSFQCNECNKVFVQRSNIIKHMRTHTGEEPSICDECGKSFTQSRNLNEHKKMHTGELPFNCNECDKSFFCKNDIIKHMRTHTGEKPFKCSECDKGFSNSRNVLKHMRTHTGEKPFRCRECDKSFSQISNLIRHQKTHSGERPFKCNECNKCFGQNSDLIKHSRTHTGEKPFKCPECGKSFCQKGNFLKHRKIHTKEKTFKCNKCAKSFSNNSTLVEHIRTHTGEKPFKCGECGKSFGQNSYFLKHRKTHSEENPFKCVECGKIFSQNSNLIEHIRTHTGEKPFKCNQCGKCFGQSSNFLKHRKTHTGEKPFKCEECDKRFSQKSHLIRHQKIHTG